MRLRNVRDFLLDFIIGGVSGVSVFVYESVKVCSEAFAAGGKAMQGAT